VTSDRPLGRPRLHLRETSSTNDRARELAAAGAPHGTLVTTSAQSAGRGRQGRSWSAPSGGALLCSLVLRGAPRLLPLAAAVATAEATGRENAQIKWPNDILLEGRKVAGILVEGRPQEGWAVCGIGLNVAVRTADLPPGLRDRAGTLGLEAADVEGILERLLAALERRLADPPAALLEAWRTRDALAGNAVRWAEGEGVARGIDGEGRLVVERSDGGRLTLDAGEVHLLR